MKLTTLISIPACALAFVLAGCSDKTTQALKLDPSVPRVGLGELIQGADRYGGKTVTVAGRFGGMCPDGADFYFKDGLEIIEVIPPAEGLPKNVVIGTPLTIQGLVLARSHEAGSDGTSAHEQQGGEEAAHEEGAEAEVKVQAQLIQVSRT